MDKYFVFWRDWDGNYFEEVKEDSLQEYIAVTNKVYAVHKNGFSGVTVIKGVVVKIEPTTEHKEKT